MITLSINKINPQNRINSIDSIENIIKIYNNYRDCNDFSNLKCPCCKKSGHLKFHKTYERNLSYYYNSQILDIKINIIVCKCTNCEQMHNVQKYHALLPEFILPYSIYEASTIIKSINDYFNHEKLVNIIEKLQINHKLFFDWLKKVNKYALSSSIVLKTKNDIKTVISEIVKNNSQFLINFYDDYSHPFFLFKSTCVPLCITH